MKKILLPVTAILIAAISLSFENNDACFSYYPMKEGVKFQVKMYDGKDKYVGRLDESVDSVISLGSAVRVVVDYKAYDGKNKFIENNSSDGICENGVFSYLCNNTTFPQSSLLTPGKKYKVKMTFSGDKMEIPDNIKPGMSLKSGIIKITIKMENMPSVRSMMPMTSETKFYNGKVVCDTTITTDAGKFDCLKITYDFTTKGGMGPKTNTHTIDWIAKNVGIVRTEVYNDNDKLLNYSVLSSISGN